MGKDLGRSGGTASSLSDNIDDPFQPLSPEEQKKAFYRHKLLADCEKATRPVNSCIPEDTEIHDIEPVNYHFYAKNEANKLPARSCRQRSCGIKQKTWQGQVVSPSSSNSDKEERPRTRLEDQPSPIHESAVNSILGDEDDDNSNDKSRDDVVDLTAEVIQEERLDEEYNSKTDDNDFRQPLVLSRNSKVAKAIITDKFRKTAIEKYYCRRAKQFYNLPDGYNLYLPAAGSCVLDCPDGHVVVYAKHFDFGLRFPLHPFVAKILKAWNDDEGRSRLALKVWVPNVGYIFSNAPLSHTISSLDCPLTGRESFGGILELPALDTTRLPPIAAELPHIEEELPSLSTVRRRLIRQSLGKDLGRSGGTASSLSDNIDDPFQPLSPEEQKKAFYRHKLLADCEKATRPVNSCIPEDTEIHDIEPVNYHFYAENEANKLPARSCRQRSCGIKQKTWQGQVVSPSSSNSDKEERPRTRLEDQPSPIHESAVNSILGDEDDDNSDDKSRDDVVDLTAEVIQEERLDEEYNSKTDDNDFRQPLVLSRNSKVAKAIITDKFRKTAIEKYYCRRAKQFYNLPDGYNLYLPSAGSCVLDCPDGHVVVYAKHFDFGLRFPLHPTFYWPHPRFDTIPERELGRHELRTVNYFDIVESQDDEGRSRLALKVWVPNVGYIFSNAPLSHVGLCSTDCYDNKQLGLSADGKRVIRRYPRAPSSRYDTLASYCSRASPVNPKRKAKKMADNQSKKRKLSTLRNRRGGNVRPATIVDKTVVQSSEPITKKMTDRVEIEDLTRTSDSSPLQPNETIPPVVPNIPITPSGSDTSISGLIYRSHQWIERPEGRFLEVVLRGFSVPPGHSGDRWQPNLDVYRNESLYTDDPMQGGNLGYRLLCNLAPPLDRPVGKIGPLAVVVMYGTELVEMYRYYQEQHHQSYANQNALQTASNNADKALNLLKEAKKRDDLELASLKDKAVKLEGLEK
uniref:Uncharacterized protein n=1 Tax=Chenopodium quinoa TaxID=63459 RepID=A0A803NB47_CHEQI